MAGDSDGLQSIFTRMDIVEEEISALKSTLDSVVQNLKILSLKIDNQDLADVRIEADMIVH